MTNKNTDCKRTALSTIRNSASEERRGHCWKPWKSHLLLLGITWITEYWSVTCHQVQEHSQSRRTGSSMSSAGEPGVHSQQNKYLISEGHWCQYSWLLCQWKHSHILEELSVNSDNALTNLYLDHSWQSDESTTMEVTRLPLGRKEIVRGNRRWWGLIKQQADFFSDSTSLLKAFIDFLASVVSDSVLHIARLTDKMASLEFIMSSGNLLTF